MKKSVLISIIALLLPLTAFAQFTTTQGGNGVSGVSTGSILFGSVPAIRMATSSAFQWTNALSRLTATNASTSALTSVSVYLSGISSGNCLQTGSNGLITSTGTSCSASSTFGTSSLSALWPIIYTQNSSLAQFSFGGLSTSTAAVVGNIPYFSGVNTFANVATGTQTISSPLTGGPFTIIGTGGAIGCQTASGSQTGCLSNTDWTTFNSKQAALTFSYPLLNTANTVSFTGLSTTSPWTQGQLTVVGSGNNTVFSVATGTVSAGSSAITVTAGRSAIGGALAIDCATASGSQNGCLSSTDWTTFNGKATFSGTTGQVDYFSGSNVAVGTSSLFIDPSTRIGIGTTSPFARLSVHLNATDIEAGSTTAFAIGSSTPSATTTLFSINNTGQVLHVDGTTALPSISFASAPTTGIWLNGGSIEFQRAGVDLFTVGNNIFNARNSSSGFQLTGSTAISLTAPNVIPNRADTTTGFASGITGNINAIVAGKETVRFTPGATGFGSSSPFAILSVHATSTGGNITTLFAIGSSTATATTTLFRINNVGDIITAGPVPTLNTCGTAAITATSTDHRGTIVVTGGTPTTCNVTFSSVKVDTPTCLVSDNSAALAAAVVAASTTGVQFGMGAVFSGNLYYICQL